MIKKLNDANAGVKRLLRISDLQDIWDALSLLHDQNADSGVFILYGFNDKGDGNLSQGVVSKDGVLYYHPDVSGARIAIGVEVYGHQLAGVDERVFDDATTQDFSFNMVANTVNTGVSLGAFTLNYVAQRRKNPKEFREVTGILSFAVLEVGGPNLDANFIPDNAEDSDVVVDAIILVGAKTLGLTIKDGNAVRMKKNFTAYLEATDNVLTMIPLGQTPDFLMSSKSGDASDILAYYSGNVIDTSFDVTYRVKILFDV